MYRIREENNMTLNKKRWVNKKPRIIEIEEHGSHTMGFLTPVSENKQIPFPIKRVFWTNGGTKDTVRGNHAHKETEEVIVAVTGTVEVEVVLDDMKRKVFILDNPCQGLYLPPNTWRTLYFNKNAVTVTIASTEYDPNDYETDMVNWLQRDYSDEKFYNE
ncbi:FdtA/QdtA family cupin domain-containing protein [Flammeovirga yaeyamensis]|uniref:FdtA/QdtA family cupin domain-containing protein n=1 Tax=Flammeovirga yaeyamensis TaxID=367791 RepID=A0AAX1N5M8_9BACT|nr:MULTISPECIES: FdtA/QdtA family cupin domain-containing protein [Flammeovirga]ANQ49782.1 WxcM-like domain-containing protein [Flammeovirga sp. MY04]MBB3697356.1 dTDP-4-dehydrorhamnose 3,5-epimerase-like enzyme [Flammeovirga yaeyamensis]NMF36050.1 WxcM-like domain-containing protein [Flammeovirga yaeyamensis]QWG02785.1 FdtA/QdtA family cupin domain-containing protein [Flammeovirga yaeyamensis]